MRLRTTQQEHAQQEPFGHKRYTVKEREIDEFWNPLCINLRCKKSAFHIDTPSIKYGPSCIMIFLNNN